MRQMILFPSISIRPTTIPSLHPNISLFHRRYQSSSTPPSMSSVKYILATKSSSLPVILIRVVVDSWRLVSYGWQQMELRRREASFHGSPSSVFLPRSPSSVFFLFRCVPLLPSSFFFVAALYENEKATSYQTDSPSRHLLFSFAGYGMLPPLRASFSPFYLDS